MKTLIITLLSALVFIGCATTTPTHRYTGVCTHPGVREGQPAPVGNDVVFEGSLMHIGFDEGTKFITLSGAACILQEQTESTSK